MDVDAGEHDGGHVGDGAEHPFDVGARDGAAVDDGVPAERWEVGTVGVDVLDLGEVVTRLVLATVHHRHVVTGHDELLDHRSPNEDRPTQHRHSHSRNHTVAQGIRVARVVR